MSEQCYIACDLGAGSGRVILGQLSRGCLSLVEVHRFTSEPVKLGDTLRWNLPQIYTELLAGLRKVSASERAVASLSADSWGVDYALLGVHEPLLGLPYHYRDARTDAIYAAALRHAGAELIFEETGVQFMPINTLYQLAAEQARNPALLAAAGQFLMIADYLHYLFCGVGKIEESSASTTQIYNPRTRDWSRKLIEKFGLPAQIFPPVIPSGTVLGSLTSSLQAETGLGAVPVIATCSHDTGAAVAAVPAEGEDWAFLSSGTWSLIGVELPTPRINDEVRALNFTNEAGYGGTTRFLKNIAGMWLLQECQRAWQRQGCSFGHDELTRLASEAEPFRSLIHPNAASFAKPDDMPGKIAAFCHSHGQPEPETPGQFVRCVLESLALLYRQTLADLERLIQRTIRRLHIVGGGGHNVLLNQFAANATGCVVLVGPIEATAAGNILIQAITLGHLPTLQSARKIVRDSFPAREFRPEQSAPWQQAALRFADFQITS